ncbi:MAG: MATE family efflux transporter [Lachnospiraceae bacterium]|nr:MATE family efflux transporter [Lachnospiraceae bacterium]
MSVQKDKQLFSGDDLKKMILPLFMEQLLVILVGMADTLIISYAGEAAVSGVSLVNQFNTIFIYLFTALASGGAVVISQYIGNKDSENAGKATSQLLMFSVVFSLIIALLVLLGDKMMLRLLFGRVEADVMSACVTYLRISALSYPMLAIYNAGASLYRSLGKTTVTMYISILSNLVNIVGNCIGVFLLHAGVAGVAWPSFIARTCSAVIITILCYRKTQEIRYENQYVFSFDGSMLKRVLGIAIPNGVENGVFQLVKVALSSIVAMFGTYQIAANGVAQSIWSLAALSGVAMGPVFITVIGQCMGNSDTEYAEYYFRKLIRITLLISAAWNLLIFLATPLFLKMYALEPGTKKLVLELVILHNIFNSVAFPFAGALGNGLRAAGDIRFTMLASLFTTVCVRLVFSWIFAYGLGLGVMGIAWAMCMDWTARGVLQYMRMRSGRWKEFKVIG